MGVSRPPRWARAVVEQMVGGPEREFVLGDMEEMWETRRRRSGAVRATLAYLLWGVRSGVATRGGSLVGGLAGDLRWAIRQVRKNPRVHLGAGFVLAVGLGGATLGWGIEHGAFGRGLPVTAPERMVALLTVDRGTREVGTAFSVRDLELVRSRVEGLDAAGLWGWADVTLAGGGAPPERIEALRVSPSLFDLLEHTPSQGRPLLPSDAREGGVVVLGHALWVRRYGRDPSVVGRTVRIDGRPTVVVGVLPPDGRLASEEAWLPVVADGAADVPAWHLLGRTERPGPDHRLQASLERVAGGLSPGDGGAPRDVELRAVPFAESFRLGNDSRMLRVVRWSSALILLMALANVANLALVRARMRVRELAVRRALGAGALRLVRQLALESLVPAFVGIAGGAALAAVGLDWYQAAYARYAGGQFTIWRHWELGAPHLAVLAAGALLSTVAVSVAAGAEALRRDSARSLRSGGGTTGRFPLGHALVAVEVAGGGALLLLASLMIRSAWNLRTMDWGFARDSVATAHVILDEAGYPTAEDRLRFWARFEEELRDLPGARSVALATQLPMIRYAGEWGARRSVEVEGTEFTDPDELPRHYVDAVTPSFFETFEAPVRTGRAFRPEDHGSSEPVAVVNVDFVRAHFPGGDPLGRRIRLWRGDEPGPWRTVVGVAPHLWMDSDEDADPEGIYVPLSQAAPPEASIAVRVAGGDPSSAGPALREALRRLDPDLPLLDVRSMAELIRQRTRLYSRDGPLFIWLGVAALVLAVTGLYAVVSYIASLRSAEFGVRAALGASRGDLLRRSVLTGVPATAAGLVVGLVLGLFLTRGFARFMFAVDPWSPTVTAASFGLLALVSLVAGLVPAVRAGRVDLVRVLDPD